MSVVLSNSIIQAIIAQGDTPDTPEEWIIAAMNLGGILASGDIKSDGSVNFTGIETFSAGLKTNTIAEAVATQGIAITTSGGRLELVGNNTALQLNDTTEELTITIPNGLIINGATGQDAATIDAAFFSGGGSLSFSDRILSVVTP